MIYADPDSQNNPSSVQLILTLLMITYFQMTKRRLISSSSEADLITTIQHYF